MEVTHSNNPLTWRTHTKCLFEEIIKGSGQTIYDKPLRILYKTLQETAQRAAELNDPQLNALMCRLTLYTIADPYHPDHNPEEVDKILKQAPNKNPETTIHHSPF